MVRRNHHVRSMSFFWQTSQALGLRSHRVRFGGTGCPGAQTGPTEPGGTTGAQTSVEQTSSQKAGPCSTGTFCWKHWRVEPPGARRFAVSHWAEPVTTCTPVVHAGAACRGFGEEKQTWLFGIHLVLSLLFSRNQEQLSMSRTFGSD